MLDPVVSVLIAVSGALLFGSAAFLKLRSPSVFAVTLGEYEILPRSTVTVAGVLIGGLEVAVAAGLLWPATRVASAVAGAALLLLYAGAMGINLARGRRDLDCGCGVQPKTIGEWMLARNLLFAAALGVLLIPASTRALGIADFTTVAGGVLVAALLYASADMLLGRPARSPRFSMEPP
ncbi:MAG TPA: MauE/DoxX family redox-associated membrane protein [Steroidobacteraceae bacterium]|nr:MauE/DoxX family redox-associated membrane protein [Steroidobacteraceae bacterium]